MILKSIFQLFGAYCKTLKIFSVTASKYKESNRNYIVNLRKIYGYDRRRKSENMSQFRFWGRVKNKKKSQLLNIANFRSMINRSIQTISMIGNLYKVSDNHSLTILKAWKFRGSDIKNKNSNMMRLDISHKHIGLIRITS